MHRAQYRSPCVGHGVTLQVVALMTCVMLTGTDVRAGDWTIQAGLEAAAPSGWVRVRENEIEGDRLRIHDDLHVNRIDSLRLQAWKPLSERSELHLGFVTRRFSGHATVAAPVYFNGTKVAPGALETDTGLRDFLAFDAAYWRRLIAFDNGGAVWGSIGARYTLLNFRMRGSIAADSVGHELKEDFYVQELPVPMLGVHARWPLTADLRLLADIDAGRLPWVNSLRSEGGPVRLSQTEVDAKLGLAWSLDGHWTLQTYAFHDALVQSERSREDGNYVRLRSTGLGLQVERAL